MVKEREHLGHKVKRLRAYRGMTQEDLAIALGKTRSLVSYLERTGNINRYTLLEIVKILEISTEDLEKDEFYPVKDVVSNAVEAPAQQNEPLMEQLRRENEFLRETISRQWELLQALSKSK